MAGGEFTNQYAKASDLLLDRHAMIQTDDS